MAVRLTRSCPPESGRVQPGGGRGGGQKTPELAAITAPRPKTGRWRRRRGQPNHPAEPTPHPQSDDAIHLPFGLRAPPPLLEAVRPPVEVAMRPCADSELETPTGAEGPIPTTMTGLADRIRCWPGHEAEGWPHRGDARRSAGGPVVEHIAATRPGLRRPLTARLRGRRQAGGPKRRPYDVRAFEAMTSVIPSSTVASSMVPGTVYSRPSAIARMVARRILPDRVFGSFATTSTSWNE